MKKNGKIGSVHFLYFDTLNQTVIKEGDRQVVETAGRVDTGIETPVSSHVREGL